MVDEIIFRFNGFASDEQVKDQLTRFRKGYGMLRQKVFDDVQVCHGFPVMYEVIEVGIGIYSLRW